MNALRAHSFITTSSSPLRQVDAWPTLPAGVILDRVAGVAVDSRGYVVVAHRGAAPLLRFTPEGQLDAVLGADHVKTSIAYDLRGPIPIPLPARFWMHGLHIDRWDNIWLTDVSRHIVMKLSPSGELLLALGEDGVAGCDPQRFNQPTHICVVPSGEIYVTDGYGNSRVVRFSPEGKYLGEWGSRGTAPGEFHSPHVIVHDADGYLYVSDRENDRIQIFDQKGALQAVWPDLHSVDGLCFSPDGTLYGSAGVDNVILRLAKDGKATDIWGSPGQFIYPHALAFAPNGDLYTAETGDRWIVTGPLPAERYSIDRAGPEGSQVQRHTFVPSERSPSYST
ncbi:MAG TPA: peptidyl-alpha-hydroxyglycine alpha-amidating lyase family protein [Opitutaceae bacterium]|nr:peptidyl-alpha-hydroxyglycine alpha-amidating lyase family protein [Opitutaceae bacterium]